MGLILLIKTPQHQRVGLMARTLKIEVMRPPLTDRVFSGCWMTLTCSGAQSLQNQPNLSHAYRTGCWELDTPADLVDRMHYRFHVNFVISGIERIGCNASGPGVAETLTMFSGVLTSSI